MLARLEAIDGVTRAEVDHRGELLRVRDSSDQALQDTIATLREIGYGADELAEAPAVERWYGHDAVRELSREEGDVIARRVVPGFARSRGIPPPTAEMLQQLVARALYECFNVHTLGAGAAPGALRNECASMAEAAARAVVGPQSARDLAALLSADLGRHSGTEE